MAAIEERALTEKLEAVERARSWSPRLVSKLVRSADEVALFRVNPIAFAAEHGVSEQEVVDLFLHAAKTSEDATLEGVARAVRVHRVTHRPA